ncbi:MAG: hypothetical protein HPM95_17135 [Alphaproteobacteria bacterium]|nr:hypothetical protein [Alphaproteobacteria bacterium]
MPGPVEDHGVASGGGVSSVPMRLTVRLRREALGDRLGGVGRDRDDHADAAVEGAQHF